MSCFAYKAKKGVDSTIEGTLEAESRDEALTKLMGRGLFPISIENASQSVSQKREEGKKISTDSPPLWIRRRITSGDILVVTQKLRTLVRARVDLLAGLRILHEQTENPSLRKVITEIHSATKEGNPFSESLSRFPHLFPPLYVSIIKSGEVSGRLEEALEQLSQFLDREEALKTKVSVALAYPLLLLLIGFTSIFILLTFVVPKLRPILEGTGRELPKVTQIILNISALSNQTWVIFLGAIAGCFLLLRYWKRTTWVKRLLQRIQKHLPIISHLTKNQELAHFSKSLALLLESGVMALKSIEIASQTLSDLKLKKQMEKVAKEVTAGQNLAKSMESFTHLPRFFTKMVAVGEESGRLSEVLTEISRSYVQQVEADIARISALIEPILILLLGIVLGGIVLAILLPTFQITQMVR